MVGEESGSGCGSGSDPGSAFYGSCSNSTVDPTTTTEMSGDGVSILAGASLAIALMALLFAVLMTLIVAVMFYFLLKLRSEVKHLRCSVEGRGGVVAKAENGSSRLVAVNILTDHPPNLGSQYKDLDQKPPPSPTGVPKATATVPTETTTVRRVTTPPQPVPKSPPSEVEVAQTAPAKITPPSYAYDNVNLVTSVLPAELRTEENLEGYALDPAEVQKLEEAERRNELSYEDVEMRMKRKQEALAGARQLATTSERGQDSGNLYTNPADAIAEEEAMITAAKTASLKKKKKNRKKSESESTSSAEPSQQPHVPDLYTTVFDHLPSGEREVVARQTKMAAGRGTSDSPSPLIEKKGEPEVKKRDVCGYEDMEDELFATSAPCKDSPLRGGAKLDDSPSTKKAELAKRFSNPAPSRRDREAMKEMVEINPRSKKPVTLSSGRRKKIEQDGVDGGEAERPKSAELSPTGKEFAIAPDEKDSPQDSYAMVDMAGKYRYRAESDSMKKEGSGEPKHYTVKERPPESEPNPLVAVET